jgi:hypothetical protein
MKNARIDPSMPTTWYQLPGRKPTKMPPQPSHPGTLPPPDLFVSAIQTSSTSVSSPPPPDEQFPSIPTSNRRQQGEISMRAASISKKPMTQNQAGKGRENIRPYIQVRQASGTHHLPSPIGPGGKITLPKSKLISLYFCVGNHDLDLKTK